MDNNNNVFSGLEDLGFNNVESIDIYKKEETDSSQSKNDAKDKVDPSTLLYDKTVTCPNCNNVFKAKSVKTSSYRILKKDSDFFIYYGVINPYFYDVWLCNVCGYAAMKSDFGKIKEAQIELVQKNISMKWQGKAYPDVYDANVAIERYKLSLLNYSVIGADSSKKAMTCLKLAWMYRILGENENEKLFLKNALEGFNDAYFNEKFPIYGMDKFTMMYLIGELNRRIDNYDEALIWFSNVITTQGIDQKLKDKARDQKDLIRTIQASSKKSSVQDEQENEHPKKKGFFSKFF